MIQPLSPAVTADELTDSEVATDHLNNPAVANVPIDTERTLPTPVTPPTSKSHSSRSKLIWIAGAAIVIVGGGIYLLGSGLL